MLLWRIFNRINNKQNTMIQYEITLTQAEDKALSYVGSQQEWVNNAIFERIRIATDEIVKICVDKCLETNTQIPSSKEDMVILAFDNEWVTSAVSRQVNTIAPLPSEEQ